MGRLATFPDSMLIFGLRRAEPARHSPASPGERALAGQPLNGLEVPRRFQNNLPG